MRIGLVCGLYLSAVVAGSCAPKLDAALVKVAVGEQRYAIPRPYFGSAFRVIGKSDGFAVTDAIFLKATTRFDAIDDKARQAYGASCCVTVLITSEIQKLGRDVLARNLELYRRKARLSLLGTNKSETQYESNAGERYVLWPSQYSDLFISKGSDAGFTICARVEPPKQRASCTRYTSSRSQVYSITFDRALIQERDVISARVIAAVQAFKS